MVFGFGEGAQLFGVGVSELLQLPLSTAVQVLDVHDICLLDTRVLPELVPDPRYEAWLFPTGAEELPVQSQNILLQLAVTRHGYNKH